MMLKCNHLLWKLRFYCHGGQHNYSTFKCFLSWLNQGVCRGLFSGLWLHLELIFIYEPCLIKIACTSIILTNSFVA